MLVLFFLSLWCSFGISGIFQSPVSGLYLFSLHVMGATTNGTSALAIFADGQWLAYAVAEDNVQDHSDQV